MSDREKMLQAIYDMLPQFDDRAIQRVFCLMCGLREGVRELEVLRSGQTFKAHRGC